MGRVGRKQRTDQVRRHVTSEVRTGIQDPMCVKGACNGPCTSSISGNIVKVLC